MYSFAYVCTGELWKAVTVASCNLFVIRELPWKNSAIKFCAVCDKDLIVSVYKDEKSLIPFCTFFSPYRRRTSTTMRTLKEQQTQRSRDEEQCRTFSLHHIPLSHMTMLFPVFWSGELHQSHLQPLSCTQNDIFLREREKSDSKYFSLIWSVFF